MKSFRISGLVRSVDSVRRQLADSRTLQQRADAIAQVDRTLNQVDAILAEHRATPRHLPPPSQRAYRFLMDLRKNPTLPVGDGSSTPAATPPERTRWRGLRSTLERNLERLATAESEAQIDKTHASIAATSGQLEQDFHRLNLTPADVSPETRDFRAWLALLSEKPNLLACIAARKLANSILNAAAQKTGLWTMPLHIHFRPMRGLYRIHNTRTHSIAAMPTPMLAFDQTGFEAIRDLMFSRTPQSKQQLHAQMLAEPYQNLQAELTALAGPIERAAGAFHDLNLSFLRVNADYFNHQMPKPNLTWSRMMTGRKFGHHDSIRDTVLLSATLDRPDVPIFVVDFVMYHELLHKKLGLTWFAGRRYVHTPEFNAAERLFKFYAQAEAWLTRLASER